MPTSAPEFKLKHQDCPLPEFKPEKVARLYADADGIERGYRYQDLLIGTCPCGVDVFAYIGLNEFKRPVKYETISHRKHPQWILRMETGKVRRRKPKVRPPGTNGPDDLGDSPLEQSTVNGCIFDKKSGKYFYRDMIAVR